MAHGDHLKYSGKPKAGKKTFLRLVSYVACDRRLLIVIGVLIVVSIAANLTGSYMLRPIINNYILPGDFHGLVRILLVLAGIYLTGGTTAAATGSAYTAFLEAAEKEDFNALAYNGADEKTKKLFVNFTKRMREEEGVKFVTVLHDYPAADHEGVISVGTAAELVYWTAGASAGAEVNESLTNAAYDGEYEVDARLKKSDYIKGIRKGQLLFYEEDGTLRVLRDINSFTSFAAAKNSDFSSNRVVRVLDSIANDVANIFSKYYLGKQSNNANGRNLLKAEILAYHEELMKLEAIEGFTADDITVEKGTEKQDVVVYEAIQPVDAMEKLYMKVEVA